MPFLTTRGQYQYSIFCCTISTSTRVGIHIKNSTIISSNFLTKKKKGYSWKQLTLREKQSTFSPSLPQLSILNETCKHLRLHEDPKEATDAFRRHRLTEGLPLENALPTLILSDKQAVMANGFQKEADKGL